MFSLMQLQLIPKEALKNDDYRTDLTFPEAFKLIYECFHDQSSLSAAADKPETEHFTAVTSKITHHKHTEKSGREGRPAGRDVEKMKSPNERPGDKMGEIYFSTSVRKVH